MNSVVWIGNFVYLVQSVVFSGLNLAFFSLSRLRLEAEAGNTAAVKQQADFTGSGTLCVFGME